jgi:ankyrin repeat protein
MKHTESSAKPFLCLGLVIILLACSTSEKEARDRLRNMGIEFSEQSFFDQVIQNRPEAVNLFLAAGMNPDVAEEDKTVLLEACRRGFKEVGSALIEAGADPDAKDEYGVTCLMYCAITGSSELMQKLIEMGADVNAKDRYGRTALIEALTTENDIPLQLYKVLIDAGADVDARIAGGLTPLMLAADGSTEILHILIDAGADLNAADDSGTTALQRAKSDPQNYEILKKAGAKE